MVSPEYNIDNNNIGEFVINVVKSFINESPLNTLENESEDKAFVEPLVGFANGADPIFETFKSVVDQKHFMPHAIFNRTFPSERKNPEDITVISWVLPHLPDTKKDNRKETIVPAERWARGRIFGETVNKKLRALVTIKLGELGMKAVAPSDSPHWERIEDSKFTFSSTWSERHIAHAAGLGTFGLCDGLITPKGKAMRVGSVVAGVKIEPTVRPYTDHHAYCLFYAKNTCGKCIERCPAGALSEKGHDKIKCKKHIREIAAPHVKNVYKFTGYGCGLCQTKVPCESGIPVK